MSEGRRLGFSLWASSSSLDEQLSQDNLNARTGGEELTGDECDMCACTCMCGECMWRDGAGPGSRLIEQVLFPILQTATHAHMHTRMHAGFYYLTKRGRKCKKWGPVTQGPLVVRLLWASV